MVNRVQTLRSATPGNRPPGGHQPGELYVNWPDGQLGVVNASAANQDLIAVRFFSALANYAQGDFVVQGGNLYQAASAIPAGAFNVAQWIQVGGSVIVSGTVPSSPPPQNGELWFDSVGGQLYCYYDDGNSKQWVIANTFSGGPFLALTGGTMTGDIVLKGNATANLNPVPLQQLNSTIAPLATTASLGAYQPRAGVTDGSNAPFGQIGEFLTNSTTTAQSLPSGGVTSSISMSVGAGDWDCWGQIVFPGGTGANPSYVQGQVNNSIAILPTQSVLILTGSAGVGGSYALPMIRISSTTAFTLYLVAAAPTYTTGSATFYGSISTRRAR
jgi:hypothetical protein